LYQRLKLQYDEVLPNFACKFTLRRYNLGERAAGNKAQMQESLGVAKRERTEAGAYTRPLFSTT
jgi:hypothetical protein